MDNISSEVPNRLGNLAVVYGCCCHRIVCPHFLFFAILDVSKDGIKIDQIAPSFRRPKFFSRPAKPIMYPVDVLADCTLVPVTSTLSTSGSSSSVLRGKVVNDHRDAKIQKIHFGNSQTPAFSTGKVQFRIIYMVS